MCINVDGSGSFFVYLQFADVMLSIKSLTTVSINLQVMVFSGAAWNASTD